MTVRKIGLGYQDLTKIIEEQRKEISLLSGSVEEAKRRKLEYFEETKQLREEMEGLTGTARAAAGGLHSQLEQTKKLKEQVEILKTKIDAGTIAVDNSNSSTKDYTELVEKLTEKFQPLIDSATQQTTAINKLAESQEESIELQKDMVAENLRFTDGLMEARREIMEITHVTKGMNKSFFQAASSSRAWTAASRLLSGTGLWSVQNAVRGVIDVVSIYQTGQEKKIEISQKATKAMENYAEAEQKYREEREKLDPALEAAKAGEDALLKARSASYRLMLQRGIHKDDALFLIEKELNATDELLKRQKKLITGGRIRQAIQGKIAALEVKFFKRIGLGTKDMFAQLKESHTKAREAFKSNFGTEREGPLREGESRSQLTSIRDMMRIRQERKGLIGMVPDTREFAKEGGLMNQTRQMHLKNMQNIISSPFKAMGIVGDDASEEDKENAKKRRKMLMNIGGIMTGIGPVVMLYKNWGKIGAALSEGFMKILPSLGFVFAKMKLAMVYFVMGLLAVLLIVATIKMMWGAMSDYGKLLKDVGLKGMEIGFRMGKLFKALLKWFGSLWKIIKSAFMGDISGVVDGLTEFIFTSLMLTKELVLTSLSLLATMAVGVFLGFANWVRKPGHLADLTKALAQMLAIWWTYALVKYMVVEIAAFVTSLIGIIPIAVALLGIAIAAIIVGFKDEIFLFFTSIYDGIVARINELIALTRSKGGNILKGAAAGGVSGAAIGSVIPGVGTVVGAGVGLVGGAIIGGAMAEGGITNKSGTFLVGEKGPELIDLPKGTTVHNNSDTRKMTGNTINVHVNGRVGANDQEIRDIARKVGRLVSQEINRTTASSTRGM